MSITLGSSTITGLSTGGLPDGIVTANSLSSTAITDHLGYAPINNTTNLGIGLKMGNATNSDACLPSGAFQVQTWYCTFASGSVPTGADGYIIGATWSAPGSYGVQMYIDIDATNYFAVRSRSGGGVWNSWRNQ